MTKVQEDIFNSFDPQISYIEYDGFDGEDLVVVVKSLLKNGYYRYTISPDGDATQETFYKAKERSLYSWSMEEHGWQVSRPFEKETAGDELFDAAVNKIVIEENKMKEIKGEKKMINFRELYSEAMLDAFKDYVRSNKEDLISYAEDTAKEKIIEHINDNIDLEEVAHNTIDDMIDYYIEYDGEGESEEELEQIICDYILE